MGLGLHWVPSAHRDLDFLRHINTLTYLLTYQFPPLTSPVIWTHLSLFTISRCVVACEAVVVIIIN